MAIVEQMARPTDAEARVIALAEQTLRAMAEAGVPTEMSEQWTRKVNTWINLQRRSRYLKGAAP